MLRSMTIGSELSTWFINTSWHAAEFLLNFSQISLKFIVGVELYLMAVDELFATVL